MFENFFKPDFAQVGIVVAGSVGLYLATRLAEVGIAWLQETKTVRFLRNHFGVIDAVLEELPSAVRERISANPVAVIAGAVINASDLTVSEGDVSDAIGWAGEKFNYNIFTEFDPDSLSPLDRQLADAAKRSILSRFDA